MSLQDKQKWDEKYIKKSQLLRPREASLNLQKFIGEGQGKKALDIACGAGRNTLYLAKNGFNVDAVDIAKVALDTLNNYARENYTDKLINTKLIDLDDFTPESNIYDLIIMANFLDRDMISRAKKSLKKDAIFIVETYMKDEENEKTKSEEKNLLYSGELEDIFSSYEIIYYDEFDNEPHEIYKMKKQVIVAKKL